MAEYYDITNAAYYKLIRHGLYKVVMRLELLDHFENCIGSIEQDIDDNNGSIVSNNQQGMRKSCSFTLMNVDEKYTLSENNFFWFNRKFRLYKGICGGGDTFWFAKGVYITQSADIDSVSRTVSIKGVDKYAQLDGTLNVLQSDEMDTVFKATPHKDRLTPLYAICLHFFRHITQLVLEIQQYSCVLVMQSDEKIDGASCAQSLCGVALKSALK